MLDQRLRRALTSGAASIVSKGVMSLSLFVAIRLAGTVSTGERYGAWLTLVTMSSLFLMLDLGFGYSLLNVISNEHRDRHSEASRKAISSAFFCLGCFAGLLAIVLVAVDRTAGLAQLFSAQNSPHATEISTAILYFGLVFFAYLPLSLVRHIYNGKQLGYWYSIIEAASAIAAFLLFLAAVTWAPTLPLMTASLVSGPLLTGLLAAGVASARLFPDFTPRLSQFRLGAVRALFAQGLAFVALQIAGGVVLYLDAIMISRLFGLAAVSPYVIPQQLYSLATMGLGFIVLPFWPAYREAIATGAVHWTQRVFRLTMGITVVVSVGASAALFLLCDPIILLWTGKLAATPTLLKAGFSVILVLYACGNAYAMLLNALSAIYIQAGLAIAAALCSIVTRLYLAHHIGVAGIVWGNIAAYVACVAVPHAFLYRKLTAGLRKQISALRPVAGLPLGSIGS